MIIPSLTGYVVVYGVLIAVGTRLFVREMKHGPEDPGSPPAPGASAVSSDLLLAY
jgi:hypothetical protein